MRQEGKILLENIRGSYGFNFLQGPDAPMYQMRALGWQKETSIQYKWNGLNRPLDEGMGIFQFTLSGKGIIEVNGEKIVLEKGKAFLVSIPSNHQYYLPEDSKQWEFVFITIIGSQISQDIKKLHEKYGQVITLSMHEPVMELFFNIYWQATGQKIVDGYQSSSLAYQFVMELFRMQLNKDDKLEAKYDKQIRQVITYLEDNYQKDLSLEELAKQAQMSKYHFNRTFTSIVGVTPIEQLTKIRLENAMRLLLHTNQNVELIAKLVGYSGANYFCKVFKKYCSITPLQFREQYASYTQIEIKI